MIPLVRCLDPRPADLAQREPMADSVNIPVEELAARTHELPPPAPLSCAHQMSKRDEPSRRRRGVGGEVTTENSTEREPPPRPSPTGAGEGAPDPMPHGWRTAHGVPAVEEGYPAPLSCAHQTTEVQQPSQRRRGDGGDVTTENSTEREPPPRPSPAGAGWRQPAEAAPIFLLDIEPWASEAERRLSELGRTVIRTSYSDGGGLGRGLTDSKTRQRYLSPNPSPPPGKSSISEIGKAQERGAAQPTLGPQTQGRLWRPNALIEKLEPGKGLALDLACGSGRDAVYLASLGYDVLAIDWLPDAIDRCLTLASRYELQGSIQGLVADLEKSIPLRSEFDLITCSFFLDRPLLRWACDHLAPSGRLLVETFTTVHRAQFGKPSRERLVLAEGELLGLAEGLEVEEYSEDWRENGRHTARLRARRL